MFVRGNKRSRLLASAGLAAALSVMLVTPSAALAQDERGVIVGSGQLPLVYTGSLPSSFFRRSFSELRTYALDLDPFQERLITNLVNWTDSLNALNMGVAESLAASRFFIEGRVIEDRSEFRQALQQWYITEALEGYRDQQKYPIRHVILHKAEDWLESSVSGQSYEDIFEQLNMQEGYVAEVVFSHPEKGFPITSQQFFVTRESQPRIAGIWQFIGAQ